MNLDTDRLILRELVHDDWAAVLDYQVEPLYLRYYEWQSRTPEDVRAFVTRLEALQHERPRTKYQLAIVLKSTGELIGNCGIRTQAFGSHEAELGFELAPKHWRNGYATEAAGELLRFGFEQLNLNRVEASCLADNLGSAGVLTKLGMRLEGRLRNKEFYKGRTWDRLLFAILRDEWERRSAGTAAPL